MTKMLLASHKIEIVTQQYFTPYHIIFGSAQNQKYNLLLFDKNKITLNLWDFFPKKSGFAMIVPYWV